jgi:hypothetical protein
MIASTPLPLRAFFALVSGLILVGVPAQEALRAQDEVPLTEEEIARRAEQAESAPLFQSHEPLVLTLRTDIDWLRDERSDSVEVDGTVTVVGADGTRLELPVEVRARGNFRRDKRNCNFPPLRLDFPTRRMEGTVFEGQDKLKLVTPCHDSRDAYQQYVLQEYLAYRVYGLLTPVSFRVRLVEITYEDTSEEYDTRTKTAFLIEDEDQMAWRNRGSYEEWNQFHPFSTDDQQAGLSSLFQYMIGNTDWSSYQFHNTKLVRLQGGRYMVVPYDFDFSGVVDARYAVPAETLPIRDVRQRLFRGFCRPNLDHQALIERFNAIRDDVWALYQGLEGLEEGETKDSLEYYEEFYETINDPGRYERRVVRNCREIG